jgi:hypothetical protein
MRQDRFLIAILAGILVLVIAALVLYALRDNQMQYGPETTPDGVVRNYVLAIEKEDYRLAYTYLSEGDGKPDFDNFQKAFLSKQLDPSSTSVQLGEVRPGEAEAVVELITVQRSGGPFGEVYRTTNNAFVKLDQAGAWKITGMPYPYWNWDWFNPQADKATEN